MFGTKEGKNKGVLGSWDPAGSMLMKNDLSCSKRHERAIDTKAFRFSISDPNIAQVLFIIFSEHSQTRGEMKRLCCWHGSRHIGGDKKFAFIPSEELKEFSKANDLSEKDSCPLLKERDGLLHSFKSSESDRQHDTNKTPAPTC